MTSQPRNQHRLPEIENYETGAPSHHQSFPKFPNPGYLGPSSHTKIFDHIPPIENELDHASSHTGNHQRKKTEVPVDNSAVAQGAKIIEEIHLRMQVLPCGEMVAGWNGKEINLALAGTVIRECAQTVGQVFDGLNGDPEGALRLSRNLSFSTRAVP